MASRARFSRAGSLLTGLALALGCAGPATPWHVPSGREERFRETRTLCRQLTDDKGVLVPEFFERCMARRGWRKQRFYERWFGSN